MAGGVGTASPGGCSALLGVSCREAGGCHTAGGAGAAGGGQFGFLVFVADAFRRAAARCALHISSRALSHSRQTKPATITSSTAFTRTPHHTLPQVSHARRAGSFAPAEPPPVLATLSSPPRSAPTSLPLPSSLSERRPLKAASATRTPDAAMVAARAATRWQCPVRPVWSSRMGAWSRFVDFVPRMPQEAAAILQPWGARTGWHSAVQAAASLPTSSSRLMDSTDCDA
mmetsp:Transcript_35497/g.104939  ORF Transcript_35497/g.104939 Transcript_35497/m.104939 type:complete len:229 (-) Transcript_35497:262-948(-)